MNKALQNLIDTKKSLLLSIKGGGEIYMKEQISTLQPFINKIDEQIDAIIKNNGE